MSFVTCKFSASFQLLGFIQLYIETDSPRRSKIPRLPAIQYSALALQQISLWKLNQSNIKQSHDLRKKTLEGSNLTNL